MVLEELMKLAFNKGINMIRVFTFVFSIYFCSLASACLFPISGPEYDALINISTNKETDSYHLKIPKKLENTDAAQVSLFYRKVVASDMGAALLSEELSFGFAWEVISGDFSAPKKEGYVSYIYVTWPAEVCSTVATSKNLDWAE